MSPLRSSPSSSTIRIISDPDNAHYSRMPHSQYYEPNPDISTDDAKEPKTKKFKLYPQKTYPVVPSSQPYMSSNPSDHIEVYSTSSDEEYEPDQTKQTTKAKKRHNQTAKKQTKLKNKPVLSQEQINALKSVTISLQEFINIYDSVPVKLRTKQFYVICKTYIHELSKTKTTMAEKQALFASLPQTLKTSFPLFELIFKQESVVLFNIMSGKTDIKDLQNSIKTLLPFFSPAYLQKPIYQFTKHKPDLSQKDKNIISTCRKHLRHLERQSKDLLPSSEKTLTESSTKSHTNDTDSSIEETTISKHKLRPEAKKILDSFKNNTIHVNDIVTSRQKLILLEVDKRLIRNTLRSFKNTISRSHRPDKNEILQKLKESGKQASKIKSIHSPISNDLKNLYSQALKGTLPIHLIKDLRKLLFDEYNVSKASSSLQSAKMALIKYNKEQEAAIEKEFAKEYRQQANYSHHYKLLREKIKSDNFNPSQFTYIYNSIPQQNRIGTLSKICNEYIKKQSEQTQSFEDKLTLLRDLPQSLQKSSSIISILFPYESSIMSSIRNGTIPSSDIHKHLSELLKITDLHHIKHLIGQHVTSKKCLTQNEKTHIAQCRSTLRQLLQTQLSQTNTDKPDSSKSHKQHPSDEKVLIAKQKDTQEQSDSDITYESNSSEYEQTPRKHKQKLHPKAREILESLNNGTIDTKDIITSRKKLVLFGIQKNTIHNLFKKFRRHIQRSHRQDTEEVLKILNEAGKQTAKMKSSYTTTNNKSHSLLDKDKNITSSFSKKIKLTAISATQPEQTSFKEQDFHPEAKKILKSLNNGTIDTEDIIASRKTLVLLGVQKDVIHNSFRRFRRHIQRSHRQDTNEILQIINEAGRQSSKIKSSYMPTSNELQSLLDKSYSGILPLENIQNLRDLLFKEYTTEKAISCLQHVEKVLVKHNKDKKQLIQEAFKKIRRQRPIKSSPYQDLKTKIKSGNLNTDTFTHIYNTIPQSDRTGTLSRLCAKYIKHLSDTIPNILDDKVKLLKSLPLSLQKSPSVLNTIFPKENQLISQMRTGVAPSCDIKTNFMTLLKIISPEYAFRLLNYYLAANKHLSTDDKKNIDDCTTILKQYKHTQPQKNKSDMDPQENSYVHNQTDQSVEYEVNNEKQGSSTASSDTRPIYTEPAPFTYIKYPIGPSLHYTNSWYTNTQPDHSETPIDTLEEHTNTTSPQPSTSYSLEIDKETVPQLSIEQISSDELTCILQSIVNEDESSKDQILLQHYLLQLANDLRQESDTAKQDFYKQTDGQPSTSQSSTYTNLQDTHIDKTTSDETSQIHEDFLYITNLAENLNHENFNQLADTLEGEIPLQELTPEEFFDFSTIDEK